MKEKNNMTQEFKILEFDRIKRRLADCAVTDRAKEELLALAPSLSEREVKKNLRETTKARQLLEEEGTPPLPSMKGVEEMIRLAVKGQPLFPEQLEAIGSVLIGIRRIRHYLERGKRLENSIAFYCEDLNPLETLLEELQEKIRNQMVDDYASSALRNIRRRITILSEKRREKAEDMLQKQKSWFSEQFISMRNGRICLPVKKEFKFKVSGSVIAKSSSGSTLFIEPSSVAKFSEELDKLSMEEENEVYQILYQLTEKIADNCDAFLQNIETVEKLDFIFAKAKLSLSMKATEPKINTERRLLIQGGRHPLLPETECEPLSFRMENGIAGIIITGPNTGGKTVTIKTVGLFCLMAQSGLHLPCERGNICMNSQVLCDIGDGQNISENLSTFSAHIKNVLSILERVNRESLVILDELGSGTDPAEGMGIAIAILEELRERGCLFLATTHYPEVKNYAEGKDNILNARMTFDKETLKPLYQLEIGKAGESCALSIAKTLGMPEKMINRAREEAYWKWKPEKEYKEAKCLKKQDLKNTSHRECEKMEGPRIQKETKEGRLNRLEERFRIGDSVTVFPEEKIGIICGEPNQKEEYLVQIQKKKRWINQKRLKLKVSAEKLYPENYDFSILFDSAENRKADHKMSKKHQPGLVIRREAEEL